MDLNELGFWLVVIGAALALDGLWLRRRHVTAHLAPRAAVAESWAAQIDAAYDWLLGRLGAGWARLTRLPGSQASKGSAASQPAQATHALAAAAPPAQAADQLAEPALGDSPALPAPPLAQASAAELPEAEPHAGEPRAAGPISELDLSFTLAPGARVRVTIEDLSRGDNAPVPLLRREVSAPGPAPRSVALIVAAPAQPLARPPRLQLASVSRLWARSSVAAGQLAGVLFGLGLLVYAVTRLVGLEQFPIYFFGDEAIQTLDAADLVRDGLRDPQGHLLPTFFQNASYYNLSLSVYAQVLPYLLFGKSVVVTRGTSALISLVAAVAAGLALKHVYRARWWWLGPLLLGATPAWFLHSRTAFETVIMVALYAACLYFYLLYRCRDPRYLYPALTCGALAFYAYSGGQMVVLVTALLLGLSDLRYHWQQRRAVLVGLALLAVLALPYLRFRLDHPGEAYSHLKILGSYWVDSQLTLGQKLAQFWQEYRLGLSPGYWFSLDNRRDLVRHIMLGYGHLLRPAAPLLLLGLGVAVWRVRRPEYRVVLIALLAAPTGGAITSIGVTRVLTLVFPAVLLAAIGVEWLLERLAASPWLRARLPAQSPGRAAAGALLALAFFALLSGANVWMLRDALINGPTWFHDYGLGGMQWGGRQVTAAIRTYLNQAPDSRVTLTPNWANSSDYLLRFFMAGEPRVRLASLDGYIYKRLDLTDQDLFVVLPDELARVERDPKFADLRVEQRLPYPDGSDGFLFVHLRYSPQADALFAAEKAARQQPLTQTVTISGQPALATYSRLDMGRIEDMFDGDPFTLGRVQEANPAVVDLAFAAPRALTAISVTVATMDLRLTAELYPTLDAGQPAMTYTQEFRGLPADPTVSLAFPGAPAAVRRIRLEITDLVNAEPKIHIREIALAP